MLRQQQKNAGSPTYESSQPSREWLRADNFPREAYTRLKSFIA